MFVTHRTQKEEQIAHPSGLSCQTYARLFFSPVDLQRATLDVCSILYERQGLIHPGDMALQAPLLQGHRDAKADSAGLNRKQKHSTYQSVKILWLETFYDYIFETSFCMEEWQLLEVGSQAEHVQFDSSDEDVESQGWSDFKGSTSSGHQTPPDPYMTCMTCMTFIWSHGLHGLLIRAMWSRVQVSSKWKCLCRTLNGLQWTAAWLCSEGTSKWHSTTDSQNHTR